MVANFATIIFIKPKRTIIANDDSADKTFIF